MTALSLRNPTLFGAINAFIAMFAFSINDVAIKGLSDGYALYQVILARSVIAIVVLMAFVIPLNGGWTALKTRRPGFHIWRGLLVVISNLTFFMALASLPLAEAVAIFFICPLLITAMSVIFLGEKVGPRRWASVGIGLLGVLIIVQPGTDAFRLASLLPLIAALSYAGLQIITRRISDTESAGILAISIQAAFIIVSVAAGLAFGDGRFAGHPDPSIAFLLREWVWPTFADWVILIILGVVGAAGGYFIAQAYRSTDAALVASFEYVAMPMALFWGFVIFNEWPGPVQLVGIALILGAGLFLVWRESVTHAKPISKTTER